MAVTHPSSMRSLIADQVTAQLDAGSSLGQVVLQDTGSTALVICPFSSTAFGAASSGVCTANAITDGTVTVAGTATKGILRSSTEQNTAVLFSVTSTGGGGDMEMSSNVLSTGQTVSVTSMTYTAPS